MTSSNLPAEWQRLFICVPLFLVLFLSSCTTGRNAKRPRNAILIAVDTLRKDHLGCYGYGRGDSRTIDALAGNGVMFTGARSAVPLTLPSFTSILTSTYPVYHGIRENEINALSDSATTLAEVFSKAGFKTKAIVGSAALAHRQGLDQGFDDYDDDFGALEEVTDGSTVAGDDHENAGRRRAKAVVDRAVEWLGDNSGDPFFLFIHFFDPHLPYDSPGKLPTQGYSPEETPVWAYDSEIAEVDRQLGRMFERMKTLGLDGNTLVVFVADHGEGLQQHYEATHGYFLYDSTIRVPLIVSCPGIIPAGKTVDGTVRTIDLMPTMIDIMGLDRPGGMQGMSLSAQIMGEEELPHVEAYFETYYGKIFMGWSALRGVQWDEWKYIQAPGPELYNVVEDPGEVRNLVDEMPEMASAMRERLRGVIEHFSSKDGGLSRTISMDLERKGLLESLGYLTDVVDTGDDADSLLPDPKKMMPAYSRRQIAMGKIILAGQLIEQERYDRAIQLLEGLDEQGDREWMVHYNLGLACMGKEENNRAREELLSALDLAPVGPERVEIREALKYLRTKQ